MSGRLAAARQRRRASPRKRHVHGSLDREALEALEPAIEVDALGTFCPEPVIRTQDQMATLQPGQVLRLLADDAGVEVDIPAWCLSTGNEYLGLLKGSDRYRVFVRRAR